MAEFVGRSTELRLLARAFESPRSALIPIYGRRRVGKSELVSARKPRVEDEALGANQHNSGEISPRNGRHRPQQAGDEQ